MTNQHDTLQKLLNEALPPNSREVAQVHPTKYKGLPPVDGRLIDALEKTIPERCPDPSMSEREIWMYAGMRKVVRTLRAAYDHHNSKPNK